MMKRARAVAGAGASSTTGSTTATMMLPPDVQLSGDDNRHGEFQRGPKMSRGYFKGGLFLLFGFAIVGVLAHGGGAAPKELLPFAGWEDVGDNVFGLCPTQPSVFSKPLRWDSDPKEADHICCKNHQYAEYSGYWLSVKGFPMGALPEGVDSITFYDVSSGVPLFKAPVGRTWAEFISESRRHGWPSFRDAEVIWSNVNILPGGETMSVNGTHLGHNLPDGQGNRYCINIVCVAGNGP